MDGELVPTTTGRVLLYVHVPKAVPFTYVNRLLRKKELGALVDVSYRLAGNVETVRMLDELKRLGFEHATKAGFSISINDMTIPEKKEPMLAQAQKEVLEVRQQYVDGLITEGERYNKVIDVWARLTDQVADAMLDNLRAQSLQRAQGANSIFVMADSGARGSTQQLKQLAGMRGLMAKPSGEIIETPITANFREGLSVLQYFISTHGARKGLADTALKTANSGYLTRRLVDVAQDVIIAGFDCGTLDGIWVTRLEEGGEVIQSLGERILGRVVAADVKDPITKDTIVGIRTEITEDLVKRVDEAGIDKIKIRSVLTCQSLRGVCRNCYGRDLARGKLVDIGEAIGIVAAQSIGEPGTQLTMRTFHIGGTASKVVEQTVLEAKNAGIVKYINLNTVKNKEGDYVALSRNGSVAIFDETGREREKYAIIYGARIKVKDGLKVDKGQKIVEWDPYSLPILTEIGGKIAFGDIIEGVTMREEVDEVTGLSRKVIIDYPDQNLTPRISIKDQHGKTARLPGSNMVARYLLPAGAHILVEDRKSTRLNS